MSGCTASGTRTGLAIAAVAAWLLCSAVPAAAGTFQVTNVRSSGPGSLAAAIGAADSDADPPTAVEFAPGLTGIINLHATLTISQSMTIAGGAGVVINGDGNQSLFVSGGTVLLSDLEFTGGDAGSGGAILNDGALTITGSSFVGNAAGGAGGAASSSGFGAGGAITNSGTLTVIDSSFIDNSAGGAGGGGNGSGAGQGGAIFNNSGSLSITGSTFSGNTAGGAGGTGSSSGEGDGGAIYALGGSVTIANSTITGNQAGGALGVGGASGVGVGGAIESLVSVSLTGDTIDANSVGPATGSSGAAIDKVIGTITASDTIVSDNSGASNCNATLTATASLESPAGGSCGFTLTGDPRLGPLADRGGPTETQALGAGSAAIGAAAAAADCPVTDQRGVRRPSGGCDVGAYELAPPFIGPGVAPVPTGPTTALLDVPVSNPDVQSGTVTLQYGTTTAYGNSTPAGTLPAVLGAPFFYVVSISGLQPGTVYHSRLVATNPDGTTFGPDEPFTTASLPAPVPVAPSNAFTFGKAKVSPRGGVTLPVNAPDAGRFAAKATFTVIRRKGGRRVKTTFTYGTASVSSAGQGTFRLVIGLSARAARELKQLGSRQVTIAVTFTPTGGTARTASTKLTIRRSAKGKYS